MSGFEGQIAIVTGGASGIGRATVERLLAEGARVAVFDREIEEYRSPSCLGVRVDITDQDSIDRAVADVVATWGSITVLINCAGIGASGTVLDNDDAEWSRVFDVNVFGAVRMVRATLPHLIRSRPAAIVNVASAVALTGFPRRALYTATKGAVLSLTRALAVDHLADGVRVNAVCPGTTATPWIQRLLDESEDTVDERARLEARQPHGRLVTPDEVADAIVYLASPRSASTNGVTLSVDAGIQSLYVRS